MENHWDELQRLFMPFKIDAKSGMIDIISADDLHDSTPRHAALILANGLASLVTPREEVWFEYSPPTLLKDDSEAVSWYRKCSDVARSYIEASNFYEEIQESYIDSPVFGTSALFCGGLDDYDELFFKQLPIGTYYIGEDSKGRVNCVVRDLHYTAEQAAEEYGLANLPKEIASKVGKETGKTETFLFIHYVSRRLSTMKKAKKPGAVDPNEPQEPEVNEGEKSRFVGYVVCEKSKRVIQEENHTRFPFAVHRYRKFGTCVWGFGPGTIAKGDSRQLSLLNDLADVGTEKSIFPPVKAPASLEGEVSQGALEITYYDDSDPNRGSGLDVWGAPAYQALAAAKERIGDKRDSVREAFHVDLFQFFASRAKERGPLTATEASLISGEKLTQFSPVYGRIVSEKLDVVLSSTFETLYIAGKFPKPPASVTNEGKGVAAPSLLYKNKIVLAQQAMRNGSLMDFFNFAAPIIQAAPEAIGRLKPDVMLRDAARNSGLPEEWMKNDKEYKKYQEDQAEVQRQQMQAQQAVEASQAAANLSKIPEAERKKFMNPEQ